MEIEKYTEMQDVILHIKDCEGKHIQQVAYSSYHNALTQTCFGCNKVRTNLKKLNSQSKPKRNS